MLRYKLQQEISCYCSVYSSMGMLVLEYSKDYSKDYIYTLYVIIYASNIFTAQHQFNAYSRNMCLYRLLGGIGVG